MEQLEQKYNALENGDVITALKAITKKENKLVLFFKKIIRLILGNEKEDEYIK